MLMIAEKFATERKYLSTQLPEEWKPPAAVDPSTGLGSADRAIVLQTVRDKSRELWHCGTAVILIKITILPRRGEVDHRFRS